jgi:predicted dehydrogenase
LPLQTSACSVKLRQAPFIFKENETTMERPAGAINIGVIGFGARSRSVIRLLLKQDPRLQLAGVYDIDPTAVERAQAEFKPIAMKVHASLDAIVHDPDIDWIVIGCWNRHHTAAAVAALDAGKNVFCEKPLATTLADCVAVKNAVARAKGTFAFGLVLRYSPHYRRIHQCLADGRLGELISFEFNETLYPGHGGYIFGNWRRRTELAGSHILEKCCHDLDLANWMANSIPVRIASFGGKRIFTPANARLRDQAGSNADGVSIYETWPDAHRVDPFGGDADLLDHQVVIMEYANGVKATFHANCAAAIAERRFYLLGTLGSLRGDSNDGTINFKKIGHNTSLENLEIGDNPDGHGGGDTVMAAGLARTMLKGEKPAAGIDEAIKSAVVALAIDEAAESGSVVDVRKYWEQVGVGE